MIKFFIPKLCFFFRFNEEEGEEKQKGLHGKDDAHDGDTLHGVHFYDTDDVDLPQNFDAEECVYRKNRRVADTA